MANKAKKAVILVSGGLDSATTLAIAHDEGYDLTLLSFDYGQKTVSELISARALAEKYQAKHRVVNLRDLGALGGSALTDDAMTVEDFHQSDSIPVTYVPARNTIFFSVALGFAEVIEAEAIFAGVCATDYAGYPDCRPEYIDAFQQLADLALKRGVEGNPVKIRTPLLHLTKAETITKGLALGVDYSTTVTCYRADEQGLACGTCESCVLRQNGFAEAGVPDPTRYQP